MKPKLEKTRAIGKVLRPALSVSRTLLERAHGCRRAEVEVAAEVVGATLSSAKKSQDLHYIATMAQVARCVE